MRVRVEHREEALGLDVPRPRLSWRLPEGASRQEAYELRLDDGTTTGRVDSADNVLVDWPGQPLRSRERRAVQVRVWTDLGESSWSEPTLVEAGLLEEGDWRAAWVSPREETVADPGFRPAYALRGTVRLDKPVSCARLYATAQGIYEASVNGERVGDEVLAPGFTEYASRLQVRTHDVTDLVREGDNELGVLLADGWFRGRVGVLRASNQWGERTAFLAQLWVQHPDGTATVVGTDSTWEAAASYVEAADLIEGQREDKRDRDEVWGPVEVRDLGLAQLVASPAPPVRVVESLRPVSVTTPVPGRVVVDFGQNINGWVRLTNLGPAGTELTLTHGEALGPDGDVFPDHLAPRDMPFLERELRAGMVDSVVSAGRDGDDFEPRFTTHGFRYLRIEGHPGELTADDVVAQVVHTDLTRGGGFACSDARIQALHDAAVWSFRGNACDIPTDCPTRERAGWTGDWQLFVPHASFLYDVAGFSVKWLRDLVTGQFDNGVLGNMAPMPIDEKVGFFESLNGSAGWGDAIVLVPWELYGEYGDVAVLEEMWPAMVRWLDFVERTAREERHPSRVSSRPSPAAHERYLWDAGFHWGEWLVPGEDLSDFGAFRAADKGDTATAYYARSTAVMADIAEVLGRTADAARYRDLSTRAADAWRTEFTTATGEVQPATQANAVRALTFDLVQGEQRLVVADQLVKLVHDNGMHLGTGFLATPDLLPVLAETGHLDTAYALLFQDTEPSWLAMIDRGATTVWELWDGMDADGVPHESLNHYSKGAVIGFLHRHVAGLRRTSPTWRTFVVEPLPGGGITSASASHDSPHGRVASSWRREGSAFELEVEVPPGCSAEVRLPSGETHAVGPGSHRF